MLRNSLSRDQHNHEHARSPGVHQGLPFSPQLVPFLMIPKCLTA